MGRPLYTTTLLARYATQTTHNEIPKPAYARVEKWSRWNAFDPDSDEFFDSENAVYEAFLSEDEIAERAQLQQRENARLLAETLLQETEVDSSSASSSVATESDFPVVDSSSRPATVEMDVDLEPLAMGRNERMALDNTNDSFQGDMTMEQQSRRQPRRSPGVFEWRNDNLNPAPTSIAVPLISVVPVEPVGETHVLSRSPSPDPLNLVSGLQHLSESPRPLVPTEGPNRAISPIPDTPARVSGVFATPPSTGVAGNSPSPAPTVTPRILSWGGADTRGQWLPGSPTPSRAVFLYVDYPRPQAPRPLTY